MTILTVLVAWFLVKEITAATTANVSFTFGTPTWSTRSPTNLSFTHDAHNPRATFGADNDNFTGGTFHGFALSHQILKHFFRLNSSRITIVEHLVLVYPTCYSLMNRLKIENFRGYILWLGENM